MSKLYRQYKVGSKNLYHMSKERSGGGDFFHQMFPSHNSDINWVKYYKTYC